MKSSRSISITIFKSYLNERGSNLYIEHILQSIERIQSYISGKDQETFSNDSITQDAGVRQLEIIGEATKRISKELRRNNFSTKYPPFQVNS